MADKVSPADIHPDGVFSPDTNPDPSSPSYEEAPQTAPQKPNEEQFGCDFL